MSTQQLLQRAVGHFRAGQLEAAVADARLVLDAEPGHRLASMLLGVILVSAEQFEEAVDILSPVVAANPDDFEASANLATALVNLERLDEARPILEHAVELQPDNISITRNLAIVLQNASQYQEAIEHNRKVLNADPTDPETQKRLALCLTRAGEYLEALPVARHLVLQFPEDEKLWYILGTCAVEDENDSYGLRHIVRSLNIQPDFAFAREQDIRICRLNQGFALLGDRIRKLNLISPGFAEGFRHLMNHYVETGQPEVAETALKWSEILSGHAAISILDRAEMYDRVGDQTRAGKYARAAVLMSPQSAGPTGFLADCLNRSGETNGAIAHLERHMTYAEPDQQSSAIWLLLGKIHDRRGDVDLAMSCYEKGNELAVQNLTGMLRQGHLIDLAERVTAGLANGNYKPEKITRSPHDYPRPAFIVGFFRSGTTLMDQFLDGHSSIVTTEELPTFSKITPTLTSNLPNLPQGLESLDAASHRLLIDSYFRQLGYFTTPDPDKLLIDRNPFHSLQMFVIDYLFPGTPIILAVRHPCDVCISNLKENYARSSAVWQFSSLDKITRTYDATMRCVAEQRKHIDLNLKVVRYEDLVEDQEGQLRSIISFLGVPWEDDVMDHLGTARKKRESGKGARTASKDQVTQPIFRTAMGKWKAYEKYLEPYKDRLMPHIETFGYSWD